MNLNVDEGGDSIPKADGTFFAEMVDGDLRMKVSYLRPDGVTTRKFTLRIDQTAAERLARVILGVD